jgi:hypothetical protein
MIHRRDNWSVVLPPTWHAKLQGDVSEFKADEAIGTLFIGSKKFGRTLSDFDLKKRAGHSVTLQVLMPDAQLEPVRIGVLSGFATKYRNSELLWQEWWLRYGSLLVDIRYSVVCELTNAEQDAAMSIINSLQIEGIDAIIDKNEDLKCVFDASGMESIIHNGWVGPYGNLPALRCIWIPKENDLVGILDVQVLCENGDIITEQFSGMGSPEERYKEAFFYFTTTSLNVFLAAFWNKYPERIQKKIWKVNGCNYVAYIGQFVLRSSGGEDGFVPEALYSEIEKAIQREKLTNPLHWINLYVAHTAGKHIFAALLDNRVWESGKKALEGLVWKKLDGYHSIRRCIILKQIGPN